MKNRQGGQTHCNAICMICGKQWDDFRTARDQARAHARRTGHRVSVEVGMVYVYEYPKRVEGKR